MKNRWIITILILLIGTPVRSADLFNKSYAVVIGISRYQNSGTWKTLDNAENDAKAMGDFLTRQGFKVEPFLGQNATRDNITGYLENILALKLTQNDRFVFYFSGHGETLFIGGRNRGYLIPYDGATKKKPSTWIAMEQLRTLADKLGNARHQLFILDSCFGGLFATKGSMSSVPEGTPGYIKTVTGSCARQYLTAGGTNQETPAHSNLNGYRQYSYYTAYILKGLREGAADTYLDGYITASELDAYLGPAATTEYNTPRGGHFPGHEQGNFVFRSPKKPA
ncbi:caspase family protein, partial [Desulfobulbus sp. TB]|nr:caspase family protein [Desulfobulbus sp. TB]